MPASKCGSKSGPDTENSYTSNHDDCKHDTNETPFSYRDECSHKYEVCVVGVCHDHVGCSGNVPA